MTKNEFNIGDRVSVEDSKCSGIVTAVDGMRCLVRFDNGRVMNFPKGVLQHRASHVPKDRKTAFLTELQSSLRKYDAEIYDGENYYITIEIDANSEDRQKLHYPVYKMDKLWLDADNIMEFDKE